jgi:hypothetical protein
VIPGESDRAWWRDLARALAASAIIIGGVAGVLVLRC